MEINIRPDLEAQIRQDVKRGPYETVDQYVERAVSLLHNQEMWLLEHRHEIDAQIRQGYDEAQRGELVDEIDVRLRVQQLKRIP